jgi:hypothetical protein
MAELSRDAMLGTPTPRRPTQEQRASWWAGVRSVRMTRLWQWWLIIALTYAGLLWAHGPAKIEAAWWAAWNWRVGVQATPPQP